MTTPGGGRLSPPDPTPLPDPTPTAGTPITDSPTDARLKTSLHEAGHAWAAWHFGRPLAVVSIRPGAAHLGVTISDRAPDHYLSRLIDGRHPLDGLDPAARRFADQGMVAALIGEQAADLLGPRHTGRLPDPWQGPPGAVLPSERAERLAEAEADEDPLTDDEIAFEMAFRLVGELANVYLEWPRAEARRLARDHARPIYALAAALCVSEVLDGGDAIAILEAQEEAATGTPPPD
jgi:hypothetical protein